MPNTKTTRSYDVESSLLTRAAGADDQAIFSSMMPAYEINAAPASRQRYIFVANDGDADISATLQTDVTPPFVTLG